MELLSFILDGLVAALRPINLLFGVGGVVLGIVVGAIPGLGPAMAIAVMIPITFVLDPASGMILLVGVLVGSIYGGALSSIMLRIPGTAAAIPAMWEGHPMAERGEAHKALAISATASALGGALSALALMFFSPPLAVLATRFGPPEFVALAILGLGVIASLEAESRLRGLIAALLGLGVSTIGLDPATGISRFTFGSTHLYSGIEVPALLIGIFAIPEMVDLATRHSRQVPRINPFKAIGALPWQQLKRLLYPIARGGIIGVIIGAIPGAGGVISTFVAYNDRQRITKNPEEFGSGAADGLAAAEAANNGSAQSSLIPLLTLGIPGSAAAAVFLGAITIHGLRPGPLLFSQNVDVIYTFLVGALLAQVWLFLLARWGAAWFVRVANVHKAFVAPAVITFAGIGTYGLNNNMFDAWMMLLFGVVGYVFVKLRLSRAAFVLAVILGPLLENNIARSLQMSRGDWGILVARPIPLAIYATLVLVIAFSLFRSYRKRSEPGALPAPLSDESSDREVKP